MAGGWLEKDFGYNFLDDIIDWISKYLSPSDVFSEADLNQWAEDNGYVNEEECENDS